MPEVLLIAPPLWNPYAPHLAVPLLASCLKRAGRSVRSLDLGIRTVHWMLRPQTLRRLAERAAENGDTLQKPILESLASLVRDAQHDLRDPAAFSETGRYEGARRVFSEALARTASVYGSPRFDLTSGQLYYSVRSSREVLAATFDAARNPYLEAFEDILPAYLRDPAIKMVGLSVSADTQMIGAMTAARLIKTRRPDVRVVAGGNYLTRLLDLDSPPVSLFDYLDLVIIQEGERGVVDAAKWAAGELPIESVSNAVYLSDGKLARNPVTSVSLEDGFVPDFDDYDLGDYLSPEPILPVMSSRSCAWNCAFCAIPFASGNFRLREPGTVVDELDALARRYGATKFMFVDEIMTIRSLKTVAAELVNRNCDYHWYTETRFARGLDRATASLLYDSGCRRLNLGLESYNQPILDRMNKEIQLETVQQNISALISARVPFHLFTMAGFPGETAEQVRRTIEFAENTMTLARQNGVDHCTWGMADYSLEVHSPVWKNPLQFGVFLRPPAEGDDIQLSLDYTVIEGMSQSDTKRLITGDWGPSPTAAVRRIDAYSKTGYLLTEPQPLVEEHSFLRAARNIAPPSRVFGRELQAPLAAGTADLAGAANAVFLAGIDGAAGEQHVALDFGRGIVLADHPVESLGQLRRTSAAEFARQAPDDLVAVATRFGLVTDGTREAHPGPAAIDAVSLEFGVSLQRLENSRAVIAYSSATNTSVRLAGPAALIALFLEHNDRLDIDEVFDDPDTRKSIAAACKRLCVMGFLAPVRRAASLQATS